MTKRILHFVLSKGSNGASLMEIWSYFDENGDDFSPASIISQMDRLSRRGLVIEAREKHVEGYQRRFYDQRLRKDENLIRSPP